jgi:L-arabinonolactonase
MTAQIIGQTPILPSSTATLAVDSHNTLGEGVLWCERSHRLFWTDIHEQRLHSLHPQTGLQHEWQLPERLACFAFTHDEHVLLLGLASKLAWFDLRTKTITPICDVESDLPTTRLNDGRCDRQGRFVFGTLDESNNRQAIASFYRLNPDLTLERLPLPHIAIANSICFSPDGDSMYFCDSLSHRIHRWDGYLTASTSAPAMISLFAELPSTAAPDGATIDADGYLWSAQWGGSQVVRYAPDGHTDHIFTLPVTQPSCVCLGGGVLTTLYITTAQESLSEFELAAQPLAGGLFHASTGSIHGLPEIRFAGSHHAR